MISGAGDEDGDAGDFGWSVAAPRKSRGRNKGRLDRNQKHSDKHTKSSPAPEIPLRPPSLDGEDYQPFMLLLCGLPGSGKSTFASALEKALPYKFVRVNQDDLGGNRVRCEKLVSEILADRDAGKCPIIDRCNFDDQQRKTWLSLAKTGRVPKKKNRNTEVEATAWEPMPVDCIIFDVTEQECLSRVRRRRDHPTLGASEAPRVIGQVSAQYFPPSIAMVERNFEQDRRKQSKAEACLDSLRQEATQYRNVTTIRCRDGDHLDEGSEFVRTLQRYVDM